MKQSKRKTKPLPTKSAAEPVIAQSATVEPVTPAVTVKETDSTYVLRASCTMREGAAMKADLMKLVGSDQLVFIDVSAVERIDTSALQLLCAFVRDRRARRVTTRWRGQPEVFAEAVDILGLASALGYSPGQRAS